MSAPSHEDAAQVQTLIEFLSVEFPGQSGAIPEPRVLRALQENGWRRDDAYMELLEELQRSQWEVQGKKPKPVKPVPQIAGRGRGGARGRGSDRPDGRSQDVPVRDGTYKPDGDRGGLARGGGRGGRGGGVVRGMPGMPGRPQDGGMAMQQAVAAPQPMPIQQPVAAPQPAATPSLPRDAPAPVQNQWSQGRPRTQEELPKPSAPEKSGAKHVPGAVWSGSQAKPNQGGASEAASKTTMAPAAQQSAAVQQPAGGQGGMKASVAAPAAPASNFDQLSQNLSQMGLSDTNGNMQNMHQSPKKGGLPEQSASTGMQQEPMSSHDYSAQHYNAASAQHYNAASAQQYNAASAQQYPQGNLHFNYQQQQSQAAPIPGTGQQDDVYGDASKMQQMGGNYGQLDAFGGVGGDKGYPGQYNGGGKPYGSGKGGGLGGQQGQGAAGQMPMQNTWQQQNMMNNTWGANMNNPYMNNYMNPNMNNMNNFNMAMYMQQAGFPPYPMQPVYGNMPNNGQGGPGNGGGQGGQGGGGGGNKKFNKSGGSSGAYNNQANNYSASQYTYQADPNSNTASQGYGYNNMSNMGSGFQGYDSSGMGGYNNQQYDSSAMGSLGYNQQSQGATGSSGMNSAGMQGYQSAANTGGYNHSFQSQTSQQTGSGWEAAPN